MIVSYLRELYSGYFTASELLKTSKVLNGLVNRFILFGLQMEIMEFVEKGRGKKPLNRDPVHRRVDRVSIYL